GMSAKPATPASGWVRTYNGTPCSWELLHSTTATTVLVATTVVSNAADVGIKLTPKVGTATVVLNTLYRHGLTNDADIIKKWQIAIWGTPKVPSVDKFCAEFSGTPVDFNMDATVIGWNNPTVQKMLNDVRYEWDDAKRAELFKQAQILMAADLPEICLNHTITPGAYRTDKLAGWDTKIGGIVVFDTTTNSKYSINQVLKMYAVSKAG
ncbi:MAG: hypothetical protein NTV30_07605, partial [Chloroflexi bacterium]|nr:hypothetical protein [Chloroflexota bacterium]